MRVLRALAAKETPRVHAWCIMYGILLYYALPPRSKRAFANAPRRQTPAYRAFIIYAHSSCSQRAYVSIRKRPYELWTLKIVAARCCLDAQRLILDDRRWWKSLSLRDLLSRLHRMRVSGFIKCKFWNANGQSEITRLILSACSFIYKQYLDAICMHFF